MKDNKESKEFFIVNENKKFVTNNKSETVLNKNKQSEISKHGKSSEEEKNKVKENKARLLKILTSQGKQEELGKSNRKGLFVNNSVANMGNSGESSKRQIKIKAQLEASNSPKDVVRRSRAHTFSNSRLKSHKIEAEELQELIGFTSEQIERLRLFFRHICELYCSYPKNSTFENVQTMYNSICLPEWMIFCKGFQITHKFKESGIGVKALSLIFRKYEDTEKRMNFKAFALSVREIAFELIENKNVDWGSDSKEEKIQRIASMLCIDSKKSLVKKLQEMGINCSENCLPKSSKLFPRNMTNFSQRESKEKEGDSKENEKVNRAIPKVYKSNLERKQSKLMHKLAVGNLNKVTPTEEVKQKLGKFSENDDRFLKEYFQKQEKVKDGLLKRLDSSINKLKVRG